MVVESPINITKRKQIIRISQKLINKGSGSNIAELLKKDAFTFNQISIDQLIKNTKYVIVGDIATRYYMPERFMKDIDILILAENNAQVEEELLEMGYVQTGTLTIGRTSWKSPSGELLDVLVADEEWTYEAIHQANYFDDGLPIISLPYLVLMKLRSGRVQDIADITRMMGLADEKMLQKVKVTIQRYLPTALEDLESLIMLGKWEYGE
ncbi:MAG: hypothetical protein R3E32_05295 [Chitinophagales bacterium]